MFLDYFALMLLIVISLILIYAAIYIHDVPYLALGGSFESSAVPGTEETL
jgi:hypothetical protein